MGLVGLSGVRTGDFSLDGSLVPVWVLASIPGLWPRVGVTGVTGGLIEESRRLVTEATDCELASLASKATLSLEEVPGWSCCCSLNFCSLCCSHSC